MYYVILSISNKLFITNFPVLQIATYYTKQQKFMHFDAVTLEVYP